MLYYTTEARRSAIDSIRDLQHKIGKIGGDKLSYLDASAAIQYLDLLKYEIIQEDVRADAARQARQRSQTN